MGHIVDGGVEWMYYVSSLEMGFYPFRNVLRIRESKAMDSTKIFSPKISCATGNFRCDRVETTTVHGDSSTATVVLATRDGEAETSIGTVSRC